MKLRKKPEVKEWHQDLSLADLIALHNYSDDRMKASIGNKEVWQRWADRKVSVKEVIDARLKAITKSM